MSDRLERHLSELDDNVRHEITTTLEDAANRLNCEPKDLAFRMDKRGGLLVKKAEDVP